MRQALWTLHVNPVQFLESSGIIRRDCNEYNINCIE